MADGDDEIPSGAERAAQLLAWDLLIQSWTAEVDKLAEAGIEALADRDEIHLGTACEVTQGALPVATAIKAVHLGTLKVIFRVLPRMAETFIFDEFKEVIEKVVLKMQAKALIDRTKALAFMLNVAIGVKTAQDYMAELDTRLDEVLGCSPTKDVPQPMRYQINQIMLAIKLAGLGAVRLKEKVHTRRG